MTDFWDQVLHFAETTANKVGKELMADFGQVQAVEKADGSLVTQSDKWADRELCDAIANRFPEHGVLSEESAHIFPDTEWCWIIDPLDGTTNFARRIPIWGVSLGLLYRGIPVFGYVHLPPLHQSFHGFWSGTTGLKLPQGAFLDRRRIHSSSDPLDANQFFSFCSRSIGNYQPDFPCKIRMLGVASYNFLTVAAGITLGGVEATPKIWDIAGVLPIIQAAGAVWRPLEPGPIFPLTPGTNYGDRSFPTLVTAQPELLPVFEPFVKSLG
ncbi:inositol monophosphatase family protein [Laspinema olomoucense]|uniref:Inositol monophosphatase family protein n=1 Tax=Laspinema olomoucense D3b TaxID=2953688 RepID=A0ABT2N3E1_9CYAN|nr:MULTISPECIES: inositol monophosphatase family protein [unclassified Laspinema]MCT7974587.1 inositol monophosphatase family protein [Laspinema sp. D3d]MCT7977102.1 inositol monophosphatase family protein [Laspinema sp. D3b]MCT7987515.1 inositol monophosphatase family protein [Laspinema sp. D3a]MCT7993608.1 inositol monophosphatase family protein [Laspinema sp. D3c]